MSHFARIEDDLVTQVIVAEQDFVDTLPGLWVQTSYNTHGGVHYGPDGQPDGGTPLRKNYAGVGYSYDAVRDAFIPPQPFPSWLLNEDTCLWGPPVPLPQDGKGYNWNEAGTAWVAAVAA